MIPAADAYEQAPHSISLPVIVLHRVSFLSLAPKALHVLLTRKLGYIITLYIVKLMVHSRGATGKGGSKEHLYRFTDGVNYFH